MEMADNLDHVVLFSGDGDVRRLIEAIQRKGLRCSVVSTVKSSPPMVADELRRQADHFIELVDLQKSIGRSGDRPVRPPREHHTASNDYAPRDDQPDEGDADLDALKTPGDFAELI